MKHLRRLRGVLCLALALALPAAFCRAEAPAAEEKGLELAEGRISVRYPAVTGLEDEELLRRVNEQILADCGIEDYLARAALMISSGELKVEWSGGVMNSVFSCAVSAEGDLGLPRVTHRWTSGNIDLSDGHEIGFDELFTDSGEARERIGAYLEEEIGPDLSAHLLNSELFPLPESFAFGPAGLTLLYPAEQLCTLSERAGDIRIGWNVLRDVLDLSGDSVLSRAGAGETVTLTEDSAEKLREAAAAGCLPGIPAKIGDSVKELTDHYHMLTDPDGFEGGRVFALEGGCFGGVFLLTDDLRRDWDDSTVQGIRVDRGCVWGLCIGETEQGEWRAVLGEPDSTVILDEEKAEANRMNPGSCDYYRWEGFQLQLYADGEGRLASVILAE